MAILVYNSGEKHQSSMSPPIPATQFSLILTGGWINATPQVQKKKSTSWIIGTLIYTPLHGHLSHTWQGKGGE